LNVFNPYLSRGGVEPGEAKVPEGEFGEP